jgi:hypothetical protein
MTNTLQEMKEKEREEFAKMAVDWDYIYELKRVKYADLEVSDFEEAVYLQENIMDFIDTLIERTLEAQKEATQMEIGNILKKIFNECKTERGLSRALCNYIKKLLTQNTSDKQEGELKDNL